MVIAYQECSTVRHGCRRHMLPAGGHPMACGSSSGMVSRAVRIPATAWGRHRRLYTMEKSVQIDPCRRENVTLFVEIRLTLGDEIKMTPVGILRRGFFCSFRNPSPGMGGINLKLQIYGYKIKEYPSMLPVGDGIKGNGRGFPYIPQQHAQICASVSVERQIYGGASCHDRGKTPARAWTGDCAP